MSDVKSKNHWETFYNTADVMRPSPFAEWVLRSNFIDYHSDLVRVTEFGCGNGRDAAAFLELPRVFYTGVDACEKACEKAAKPELPGKQVVCADFSQAGFIVSEDQDIIYSRMVLHSITAEGERETIKNAHRALRAGGIFCIEARTVDDAIYGVGSVDPIDSDAFIHGHYRRFIRPEKLRAALEACGFEILACYAATGLSIVGDSNPCMVRIVAKKS